MKTIACSALALALALTACTPLPAPETAPARVASGSVTTVPETQPIRLMTHRSEYRPGGQVVLALVNHTDATYTFNPCTRWLERQEQDRWTMVQEPDRVCTMIAWLLDPHSTRDAQTELPANLRPGTYRMVLSLVRDDATPAEGRVRVESRPFAVPFNR